ncbi:ParB N-terminal domain-containing protein [Rhodoferax sp.]|uniref:ParB N-terminal domain-containing protein n=1 Tax=Rhodoferax sp. TaxID=50421 RepID=UPI002736F13C|nr:ParB N-terminal domain-containing protein [Rhodoferax sp.]MDP3192615.1 ParB N-terminal domain-containing protein [Rhodoferax sp.]MDP3335220.1 ParB N-terminal domain-containing protein [Rhodoferax sp.]
MSRSKQLTRSEVWSELRYQLANGKPMPATKPATLTLRRIKLWPEVFQQRRPAKFASDAHIRTLASKAKASTHGVLDPLTVWWDGKTWACIDGHHRMEAYRTTGVSDIPVAVFEGSIEEALTLSAKANTRDKLQMSRGEKSNAAWHLVVVTKLSKAAQAEASGVSERQVAHMRRVKEILEAKGERNLQDLSWETARRMAAGEDVSQEWDEGEIEKRAEEMATRLHKALGKTASKQIEVFARAVELYSPTLASGLVEYWQEQDENEEELEQQE